MPGVTGVKAFARNARYPAGVKTLQLRILNFVLWLVFCVLAGTGFLLSFRLPPGSRGGAGLAALGWGRHDWGDFHMWTAWVFIGLLVIHLGIHWRWFWQAAAKRRAWPLVAGFLAGLALIVTACVLPVAPRHGGESHRSPAHEKRHAEER